MPDPTGTNTTSPSAPSATGTASTGQLPGTATNDSATAGKIGEYTSTSIAAGSAIPLSTGAATTIVSLPLSAGDWDVWGQAAFKTGPLTVVTSMLAGVNSTAGQPSLISGGAGQVGLGAGLTGIADTVVHAGPVRISLAAAGTAFMMGTMAFATSTSGVYGILQARRKR